MGVSSPVTEKGRPQWEKDRALHYQAVNDKNVPQPCPLLWVPGLFLILRSGKQLAHIGFLLYYSVKHC